MAGLCGEQDLIWSRLAYSAKEPGGGKSTMGSWWCTPRKWNVFFGRWIDDRRRLGPRGARRLRVTKSRAVSRPTSRKTRLKRAVSGDTDYIVDTCEVISAEEAASKVLGVEPDSKLSWHCPREVMAEVVGLHVNIEGRRDVGVEKVLKTECVGVTKVLHILRAAGDRLSSDELGKWDKHVRDSLGRTLNGELDDHSWWQVVDGFQAGRPQLEGRVWTWPSLRSWRHGWVRDRRWRHS